MSYLKLWKVHNFKKKTQKSLRCKARKRFFQMRELMIFVVCCIEKKSNRFLYLAHNIEEGKQHQPWTARELKPRHWQTSATLAQKAFESACGKHEHLINIGGKTGAKANIIKN